MRKIRLLLSCKLDSPTNQNYVDAFSELGAEATARYSPEADTSYDGLVLCGGSDVHPSRFGEENDGSVGIDLERDAAEFDLMRAYVDAKKPILGICRGYQVINIFFGGSLYQDISESDFHKKRNGEDNVHTVSAIPDSVIGRLYGESFAVNSAHHQALKALGEGIRATAFWNGQYAEAIEHTTLPIFGVQWHPERMCFKKARVDTVCGADILSYFVNECKKRQED